MKIPCPNKTHLSGSALVITLTVVVITAILLGSYLTLVQYQTAAVARSQAWNAIIPVSEAGIEEGMAMINGGTSNLLDPTGMSWTNNLVADGWSPFSNGTTSVTRYLSGTNVYYTTTLVNDPTPGAGPSVSSLGYSSYSNVPWLFGSNTWAMNSGPGSSPFFLAAAGTASGAASPSVARKLQVKTVISPLFAIGVACKSNFNMNGQGCRVDSFDSSDANYSSSATASPSNNVVWIYDLTKAKAGGDVGVNAAIVGDVNVGNGTIYGHLHTGPGDVASNVQIGSQGAVGDLTWGGTGIENLGTPSSWWTPDFNVNFPDVKAPTFAGIGLPPALGGYVTLNGGKYTITSTSPGNLLVLAPTTLWVKGSCQLGVTIGPNGSLVLYVGKTTGSGDRLTLTGNGTMNQPGYARNLVIFGLPSLTSVDMSGNAGWTGCLYAPNADFTGGGGGGNNQDTQGSIVVKSITLNGHWNFHFDENLKLKGAIRGAVAKNWTELKPN
jgi:hypothetical protein